MRVSKTVKNLGKFKYPGPDRRPSDPPVPDNARHPLAGAFNEELDCTELN